MGCLCMLRPASALLLLLPATSLRVGGLPKLFQRTASPVTAREAALVSLLSDAFSAREPPNEAAAVAAVRDLSSACVPFDAARFGDGLWITVYTCGAETPRWQRLAQSRASRLLPSPNVAGQRYSFSDNGGRVLNYAELVGAALHITAGGAFEAVDAAQRCPKDFSVQIDGGTVCVGGLTLALPISGPGYLRVLYTSPAIRILTSLTRSPDRWEDAGLVAVQLPAERVAPDWVAPCV
ncbi:hypothetical protein EMIHUDRAFT_442756 [Emiliania huxleyi CCMP1516]|uniref:Plastid lipid-associated protein/fibrillin conserved domain-containing protein n=3 Tax=Emiliania huxleyi TaxID=2903 RepID=A0A0D3K165_EMIH1|nr:hypothetical protein EMIHUDRAFT_442756 [Emiliania huxleyi CCMP1516]EOD29500.1 hypothetical protein EMIHUDRAFT_442756 [Emiliania huxleyi CCMP1516]|eukprot:XP_005781929.1 hypothetical protein EMIHUDRAFT_442756 [Emiliania huxleyi CCMP1516]